MRELLHLSDRLGASKVATGHYARVRNEGGRARLFRGVDREKDQSYFLHMLPPDVLDRLVFPLGYATKREVRAEALALGLPSAGKGDSQELCFVPEGRYDAFVANAAPDRVRPGRVVDADGRTVGRHRGIHAFTIGQRKNLAVSLGHRAYVVALDPEQSEVRLGSRQDLLSSSAIVSDPALADDVVLPARCEVAVRHRAPAVGAVVTPAPGGSPAVEVRFDEPIAAVVPGQYAVFFRSDRVLGGGPIARAGSAG
jgi:tRNA-specific 2-thiouridylase